MPDNFIPTSLDYIRTFPEIVLIFAGTMLMILEGLAGEKSRKGTGPLALFAILIAFAAAFFAGLDHRGPAFSEFSDH